MTWNKWLVFTKISYYGIEQHITLTLTDLARLELYVYHAYYMTLFNIFTLHAGLWSRGMTLASHGERPWLETHITLCSICQHLSIGRDGQLYTSLYDKRDDFNFHITNFPFLSSNIPSSPAYGVFISQLIRYVRASSSYECFILRAVRLSNKLLGQRYVKERLRSSLRKFYGRYGDLIKQYEAPSRM